jgi:lambda repressor-like predicted transcriptional regulator
MDFKNLELRDFFIAGLEAKLKERDWNPTRLSQEAGISKSSLSGILNKKKYGRIQTWELLAKKAGFNSLYDCIERGRNELKGILTEDNPNDPFESFVNPGIARECLDLILKIEQTQSGSSRMLELGILLKKILNDASSPWDGKTERRYHERRQAAVE